MTTIRFVPAMYGTNAGGLPEGSPEAAAAVARVKAIMAKRTRSDKVKPMPQRVTHGRFADWLRRVMETRGDTIASLAATLDVGMSAVGRWRSGESTPRGATRLALAERYGVTVERIEALMREEEQAA